MSSATITELPGRDAAREVIAAPIRAHLAVKNISGSDLARRIGLTQPQISRRLSGRLPFTSDDLNAIAAELDLTVVELIQMPKPSITGGGTRLVGVGTTIHRLVGRTGLEPVTDGL
ncbi:helix-turn-helix transcriptional regulator [Homoserinibacter sp. GY 40078]|uniref:helix-turn-helix domain-containing protein n=1 Tax=Homoserinibacter sp. GY 40078 TaxID=2603275 RepID=UPI0011C941D2|nr:helix-turn-helix transcriptional regulator [Homoserinibacter sp. GY 40078]